MEQKGVNRAALAQRVGTSKSFITQLFRGDRTPSWKILAKIAKTLDLEFVVTTKGESRENEKGEYNTPDFEPLYIASPNEINVVAA